MGRIQTMVVLNKRFTAEAEKIVFVEECERQFNKQLLEVTEHICTEESLRIVMLSGPTCSGKTTTASQLARLLKGHGKRLVMISIDDFYRDRGQLQTTQAGTVDYESIEAIDFPYLAECMSELLENREVLLPIFDFTTGCRSGVRSFLPQKNDILLFEGIQAIYPEILSLTPSGQSTSIYISPQQQAEAYGAVFSPRSIRFLRRLVRDSMFRASDAARTFFLWEGVKRNEDENILPYASGAAISIDSFLPYELNVIRPFAESVLRMLPASDVHAAERDELLMKLSGIPVISPAYVPENSFFREFIGSHKSFG